MGIMLEMRADKCDLLLKHFKGSRLFMRVDDYFGGNSLQIWHLSQVTEVH